MWFRSAIYSFPVTALTSFSLLTHIAALRVTQSK